MSHHSLTEHSRTKRLSNTLTATSWDTVILWQNWRQSQKRLSGYFKRLFFNSSLKGISFYCLVKAVSTPHCSSGTRPTEEFLHVPKFECYLPFSMTFRFQSAQIHNFQKRDFRSCMTLKLFLRSVTWLRSTSQCWRTNDPISKGQQPRAAFQ